MQGSQKQVEWANKIKLSQMILVNHEVKKFESELVSFVPASPDEATKVADNARRIRAAHNALVSNEDARFWIDTRNYSSWLLLKEFARKPIA